MKFLFRISVLAPILAGAVLFVCGQFEPAMGAAESSPRQSWSRTPPPIDESNPQAALLAAEKRFEEAQKSFNQQAPAPSQEARQNAEARRPLPQSNSTMPGAYDDPRISAYQGSPETGYSGTWTDPATGDIITSVIAPAPQQAYGQMQNYPIIIEPQVSGMSWDGSSSSQWQPGSNSGWQSGWPQWPGHPGDNGYPPPPPPANMPGMMPSPGMGQLPGYIPNNPLPPFAPGYRPLRPGQGMPVQGGAPFPGAQPGMPPAGNSGWPPSYQPAPPNAWQPNAPGTPGWVPPSYQPAPPNAWQPGRPPSGWRPGGGFRPVRPIIVPGSNPGPR